MPENSEKGKRRKKKKKLLQAKKIWQLPWNIKLMPSGLGQQGEISWPAELAQNEFTAAYVDAGIHNF